MYRNNITVACLQLDSLAWKDHGNQLGEQTHLWETPDGDAVAVYYFDIAPNLPRCAKTEELWAFYADAMSGVNGRIVDCRVVEMARLSAIQSIVKVPQEPSGYMYQGMITLPFRDFSFMVKVQCAERGKIGAREAELLKRRVKAGERPTFINGNPHFKDWNPDSEIFDADFRTHPVSRARRLLKNISESAQLIYSIRLQPGFALPAA